VYAVRTLAVFVPMPDKNYQVQARIYKVHPIKIMCLRKRRFDLDARNWNEVSIGGCGSTWFHWA